MHNEHQQWLLGSMILLVMVGSMMRRQIKEVPAKLTRSQLLQLARAWQIKAPSSSSTPEWATSRNCTTHTAHSLNHAIQNPGVVQGG